jgi:hypothetical protein
MKNYAPNYGQPKPQRPFNSFRPEPTKAEHKGRTEEIYDGHSRNLPNLNEIGKAKPTNNNHKPQVRAR